MAEARERSEWNRTSQLLALTYNANRDPAKTGPKEARDFHPLYRASPAVKLSKKQSIAALKSIFLDGKIPPELDR